VDPAKEAFIPGGGYRARRRLKEAWSAWTKSIQEWRKLSSDLKDAAKRKAHMEKRAEARKEEAERQGLLVPEDPKIDWEDLDILGVENVLDVGDGEPLFTHFAYEDWTLLSIQVELHLLLHAFRRDLNDPDRPSFTERDLCFYFNRYFKKTFNLKNFAAQDFSAFAALVRDTIEVKAETSFLEPKLGEETPYTHFLKLVEYSRRERHQRFDAGDETAELKFPRNMPAPPPHAPPKLTKAAEPRSRPSPPTSSQLNRHTSRDVASTERSSRRSPAPVSRRGDSRGTSRHHYGSNGDNHKRAAPSGSDHGYSSSKHARTSSYSGSGYGKESGGGYSSSRRDSGRHYESSGYHRR